MKKSNWFKPYTKSPTGKLVPTLKDCTTCAQAGVYLIRNLQTGTVVYVGSSTTMLKKTIYRHFQTWTDRQRKNQRRFERKTYPKTGYYEVRFFKCTPDQARRMEKFLIRKLKPQDNPLKYEQLKLEVEKAGEKLYKDALATPMLPPTEYLEPAPF